MKHLMATRVMVGADILVAALVRLAGVAYDLPYIYHPDEPGSLGVILHMVRSGDLNPHSFLYPSFFYYLHALAYVPYFVVGSLIAGFHTPADILPPVTLAMGTTLSPMPTTVLMGRLITLVLGVALVGVTYSAGLSLTRSNAVGLLGALLVALSPTAVTHSRYLTPDVPATLFAMLALLASAWAYRDGNVRQYVLAGLCAGLAASIKYNAGLVVLALVAAHGLRRGWGALGDPRLYLGLVSAALAFVLTMPIAVLDVGGFFAGLQFQFLQYAGGHAGMEGNTLWWYLSYLGRAGGLLYVLAVVELMRGLWARNRATLLLAIFPVVYFCFISTYTVRNDRTILPLMPFALLLSANLMVSMWNWLKQRRDGYSGPLRAGLALAMVLVVALPSVPLILREGTSLAGPSSRETGRTWISQNLPPGSKIMLESYAPWVDPTRYDVQGVGAMIDHLPKWYMDNGFDYLVFSSGMYARFYNEPDRYAVEIARYDALFGVFRPAIILNEGGEIRVYSVK